MAITGRCHRIHGNLDNRQKSRRQRKQPCAPRPTRHWQTVHMSGDHIIPSPNVVPLNEQLGRHSQVSKNSTRDVSSKFWVKWQYEIYIKYGNQHEDSNIVPFIFLTKMSKWKPEISRLENLSLALKQCKFMFLSQLKTVNNTTEFIWMSVFINVQIHSILKKKKNSHTHTHTHKTTS